jgi:hypothetical protein
MIEDSSTTTSKELLIEELRMQYNKDWDIKDSLDGKASSMITVSATVAALLFGFGAFMLKSISPSYEFMSLFLYLLIASIVGTVASIILSTLAFRIQKYKIALGDSIFYDEKTDERIEEMVEKYKTSPLDKFRNTMVNAYLKSIRENNKRNRGKAKMISIAQIVFSGSMIVFPILLWILVNAMQLHSISFSNAFQ